METGVQVPLSGVRSDTFIVAVIPAYNEARSIAEVVLRAQKFANAVLVCDDGSTDMTGEICEALGVKLLTHEVNQGKGVALRTLFEVALDLNPSAVVSLDADGQHNPENIPRLVAPVLSGVSDIVVGSRYADGSKIDAPLYRRLGLRLFKGRSKKSVRDTQSGFRAFSVGALNVTLQGEAVGFGVESEQLVLAEKSGLRVSAVPVKIGYKGVRRTSSMNPVLHGVELFSTIIRLAAEEKPLILLGVPGFVFITGGLLSGVILLVEFNDKNLFSVPYAILSLGGFSIGMLLGIGAMILYAIGRIKSK
jgi:glycosyltransferase involved in cell wall biosynthesis